MTRLNRPPLFSVLQEKQDLYRCAFMMHQQEDYKRPLQPTRALWRIYWLSQNVTRIEAIVSNHLHVNMRYQANHEAKVAVGRRN